MKDDERLPGNKKEERDPTLAKLVYLAPLIDLVIHILEFLLKICRIAE